jgi:hypothetical protein
MVWNWFPEGVWKKEHLDPIERETCQARLFWSFEDLCGVFATPVKARDRAPRRSDSDLASMRISERFRAIFGGGKIIA